MAIICHGRKLTAELSKYKYEVIGDSAVNPHNFLKYQEWQNKDSNAVGIVFGEERVKHEYEELEHAPAFRSTQTSETQQWCPDVLSGRNIDPLSTNFLICYCVSGITPQKWEGNSEKANLQACIP